VISALLLLAAATTPPASPAKPQPDPYAPGRAVIADIDKIVTPHGVQETFVATLGSTKQVVSVRGADRDNPILLFIHGGPGAVEMPIAWSFERPWEDYFTVVQWDQRGAGRSYPLNDPATLAPTLSLDRYRDDAIELIQQLEQRYGKRKIFVMGHSWGSAVGLAVAAKRPDLLYAYVGMGQMIDTRANEQVGYDWTLAQARARQDATAVKALEAIAPYPGSGPIDVSKLGIERTWSVRYGALAADRDNAHFYFNAAQLSPEYSPADLDAWDKGSAYSVGTLFPKLADLSFTSLTHLDVPVILFEGRHDYTCAWPVAERWFDRLDAPGKKLVWFDHSAHLPLIEEPGRVFAALLQDVRPLADH
jgi:pimeloyl-ACP methyl ester carboxylesterase